MNNRQKPTNNLNPLDMHNTYKSIVSYRSIKINLHKSEFKKKPQRNTKETKNSSWKTKNLIVQTKSINFDHQGS